MLCGVINAIKAIHKTMVQGSQVLDDPSSRTKGGAVNALAGAYDKNNPPNNKRGNEATTPCAGCGRDNHAISECVFLEYKKPGNKQKPHPLIEALHGKPFEGSTVQQR